MNSSMLPYSRSLKSNIARVEKNLIEVLILYALRRRFNKMLSKDKFIAPPVITFFSAGKPPVREPVQPNQDEACK